MPGVEAALAKSVVLHAEGEDAAGSLALHGVSFTVQAEAGSGGRGGAGAGQHHPPPGRGGWRTAAPGPPGRHLSFRSPYDSHPTLHPSSLGLHHPFYPRSSACGGLPLFKALVAMGLRVHRDVEGAPRCGTADLDEGELGDGEGRWALRLGGPCLLLVLLPALVLVVNKLQVVLHQVHVFREVPFI